MPDVTAGYGRLSDLNEFLSNFQIKLSQIVFKVLRICTFWEERSVDMKNEPKN